MPLYSLSKSASISNTLPYSIPVLPAYFNKLQLSTHVISCYTLTFGRHLHVFDFDFDFTWLGPSLIPTLEDPSVPFKFLAYMYIDTYLSVYHDIVQYVCTHVLILPVYCTRKSPLPHIQPPCVLLCTVPSAPRVTLSPLFWNRDARRPNLFSPRLFRGCILRFGFGFGNFIFLS